MVYTIRTNIDPSSTSGTELADIVEEVGDLTQIVVESDTSNQPGSPSEGDAYIANGDASWVNGSQYDVAVFRDSTWIYHTPEEGWVAYIKDRSESRQFNGTDWSRPFSNPIQNVDSVSDLQSGSFPASLERIWLSGYYGVGTAGGGPLYRDSGDTTTADNGWDVFVDSDAVRWKRVDQSKLVVTDGGILDDRTDQTTELASLFSGLESDFRGHIVIPDGVKFTYKDVINSLPYGAVVEDWSETNDNDRSSYHTKNIGVLTRDKTDDDAIWRLTSGHHPNICLNNLATSGTSSSDDLLASLLWGWGYYDADESGVTNDQGRFGGRMQWAKHPSLDVWRWHVRAFSPWEASTHQLWAEGKDKNAGDVVRNGSNFYRAATSGTTGSTAPTHTTGTQSDGGVDWEWFFSADATIFAVDQYGNLNAGNADADGQIATFRKNPNDPNPKAVLRVASAGTSEDVEQRFFPTDGSGNEITDGPFFAYRSSKEIVWFQDGFSERIFSWNDTEVAFHQSIKRVAKDAADGDTTPSVSGVSALALNYSSTATITYLDDGEDDQEVLLIVHSSSADITVQHGSNIKLSGGINVTLTADSTLTLRRNAWSSRWVEVARSVI